MKTAENSEASISKITTEYNGIKITIEVIEGVELDDLLDNIRDTLKGLGYSLDELEIVNYDKD